MRYGANHIHVPQHLVPRDRADFVSGKDWGTPLSELEDGEYTLWACVLSEPPAGSGGRGIEYNVMHPDEVIGFTVSGGTITLH